MADIMEATAYTIGMFLENIDSIWKKVINEDKDFFSKIYEMKIKKI